MGSIIGERPKKIFYKQSWNNASASDLSALDDKIIAAQAELTRVSGLLETCNAGGLFYSCHAKLGRSKDGLNSDVAAATDNLAFLKKQRADLAVSIANALTLSQQQLSVIEKTAAVDQVQSAATTNKVSTYLLIGGGLLILSFGAVMLYKKIKK